MCALTLSVAGSMRNCPDDPNSHHHHTSMGGTVLCQLSDEGPYTFLFSSLVSLCIQLCTLLEECSAFNNSYFICCSAMFCVCVCVEETSCGRLLFSKSLICSLKTDPWVLFVIVTMDRCLIRFFCFVLLCYFVFVTDYEQTTLQLLSH